MSRPAALQELARLHGVQLSYYDATGQQREASADALVEVLKCLGAPLDQAGQAEQLLAERKESAPILPPVIVAWDGELPGLEPALLPSIEQADASLCFEHGEEVSGRFSPRHGWAGIRPFMPARLPMGYHELKIEAGDHSSNSLIIAAPTRAYSPAEDSRTWGIFLPLYALRSPHLHGIGDFSALGELGGWAAQLGAHYIGTLPLLATFLDQPFDVSPYSPVSRLFWNEIFLDVDAVQEQVQLGPAEALARLNESDLVDYATVARLKRRALEPMAEAFFQGAGEREADFRAYLSANPHAQDYARFRAERERNHTNAANYHLFVQYMADRQLAQLERERGIELYLDVPIGVHPDGYDAWRFRDLFANGVAAGAPPDAFFTQGQNWGFAPTSPTALRADRYQYLRAVLGVHLRHAGALRLDHVMSLHRLFWIPSGMDARDGVYVRYPADELYALLSLESHRHQARIVGEDLGTVPPEVRETMDRHNIARMYVVQFELRADQDDPLPPPPAHSVASLNTHDMPTFEGFRRGLDAGLREELGLMDHQEVETTRHDRRLLLQRVAGQLERAGFLHGRAEPETLRDGLLAFLAASAAGMHLVNLEDLWREDRPQNIPGTGDERNNWRRRMRPTLEEVVNSPDLSALLTRLNHIRLDR